MQQNNQDDKMLPTWVYVVSFIVVVVVLLYGFIEFVV